LPLTVPKKKMNSSIKLGQPHKNGSSAAIVLFNNGQSLLSKKSGTSLFHPDLMPKHGKAFALKIAFIPTITEKVKTRLF
jgi:hypothetical protein